MLTSCVCDHFCFSHRRRCGVTEPLEIPSISWSLVPHLWIVHAPILYRTSRFNAPDRLPQRSYIVHGHLPQHSPARHGGISALLDRTCSRRSAPRHRLSHASRRGLLCVSLRSDLHQRVCPSPSKDIATLTCPCANMASTPNARCALANLTFGPPGTRNNKKRP